LCLDTSADVSNTALSRTQRKTQARERTMELAVGTKVEACNKVWTVARVGSIYYHMAVAGSEKLKGYTFEIPKNEAHDDIASGKAKVIQNV